MRAAPALLAAACALAWTAAAAAPAALAHGERDPAVRTIVDAVEPEVPGLSVRVAPGVAQRLEIENRSGTAVVEVLASSGEPFLRVGPRGVEANVASATWFASGNPDGIYRAPGPVGRDLPPRWRRVSPVPRWTWFAHELHPDAAGGVPPDVVRARRRARLGDWRIGLRADGREGAITGHLEYRPVLGSFIARLTTPAQVAPGLTVAPLNARAPGLFLASAGDVPVVVEGEDGRPFARLRGGTTTVDVASPTYREQPGAPAGPPAPVGAPRPRWRRVPTSGTLSWIEPRMHYAADELPPEVLRRGMEVVVRGWAINLRVGGQLFAVRGETRWVPAARAGDAPARSGGGSALPWLAAAVLAALGGAWLLRRRARAGG